MAVLKQEQINQLRVLVDSGTADNYPDVDAYESFGNFGILGEISGSGYYEGNVSCFTGILITVLNFDVSVFLGSDKYIS